MRSKSFYLLFLLIIAIFFCVTRFVLAAGLLWRQNDWLGGSGESVWSDTAKYYSASNLVATTTGLILQTKSGWYDAAWKYRQTISVTNNAGADLIDYQVPIYINTSELISASKMETDCRDLRILDSSGHVLPIWLATSPAIDRCGSTATKVWVKIPVLSSSGASLSFYYGNSSASAVSNGSAVFPVFADFTNTSSLPDGWEKTDIGTSGSATFSGGALSISNTNGEDVWEKVYGATHVYNNSTVSNSFIAETLINSQIGAEDWAKTGMSVQNTVAAAVGNGQAFIVTTPGNGVAFQYQFQSGDLCPGGICQPGIVAANIQTNGGSYSFPSFLKLVKNTSSQVSGFYSSNGSTWNQQGSAVSPWGIAADQYVTLFVTPHTTSGSSTATYSFFYIRSYSDSEPTVSGPQSEETRYLSAGNLTSSIFDTSRASDFGTASYSYTAATNTSLVFKIRSSDNADMAGASDFSLCAAISSGTDITDNNCVDDQQRYVQYQISLSSSDGLYTPKFEDIELDYSFTPVYTLSYSASTGGHISGSATQSIYYGRDGSGVSAEANSGYYFSGWDDGSSASSRLDKNIKTDFSVLARFIRKSSASSAPSTPKISLEPSSSNEIINWSATNVYQMAIADSEDFSKSSWLPYEDSYKTSDKTLYIKFRSPDGGESQVYVIPPAKLITADNNAEDDAERISKVEELITPITPIVEQSVASVEFLTDLEFGMNGFAVRELQKFLNNNGFLLATVGIGSPGQESTYFGRLTSAALVKFQKANNIFPALGYFGPITRKLVNKQTSN